MKNFVKKKFINLYEFILKNKVLVIVIFVSIIFATLLMSSTLSYDNGNIVISDKVYSDFNAHLPLIRSFSFGDNTPLEYPLFTGEKIKYHFLFYFIVGILEKYIFRIDLALNLLSIIGFAGLMISIYLLALKITKSKAAGILSVIFFLFNSSLSWIYFFIKYPLSGDTLKNIINLPNFVSFGPYDDNIVSAFWSLNVYTNQRHFAFALFLMFVATWAICYSRKKYTFLIGIIILAIMPITHKAVLMILVIILISLFFTLKEQRKRIFLACLMGGLLSLPGITLLASASAGEIKTAFGYIYNSTSWKELPSIKGFWRFIVFWFLNLGILPLLATLGMIFIEENEKVKFDSIKNKHLKKITSFIPQKLKVITRSINKIYFKVFKFIFNPERIWWFIALLIFIIGNTFTFATDLSTNHKLFNFTSIIFGIYAAYFIIISINKSILSKILTSLLCIFLILGGIIDFFPNFNFRKVYIEDISQNYTMNWIYKNTDKKSQFLNLTEDNFPILLAGRRVYYGQEYLNWSIGYPIYERRDELIKITEGKIEKNELCQFLTKNNLSYIFISSDDPSFVDTKVSYDYFDTYFKKENLAEDQYKIYNTATSCQN